jgi:hypothetical protein
MPQCQFPVFCCFCVLEKLHRNYSQNWMKQKPNLLFFQTRDEVRRWERGGPGAGQTLGRHDQALARATRGWGRLVHLLMLPFCLYIPLDGKNLKGPINFPRNLLQATAVIDVRSSGSRSSSQHPAKEGNHRRRPSSSPWSPPKWCVSSLLSTTGP